MGNPFQTGCQMVRRLACAATLAGFVAAGWAADDFDQPPISYRTATPANAVSRLQARIDAGAVRLPHEKGFGHLRAVLAELAVPVASQTLVFSKTSLQYSRISSRSPRAVYFNDDVYVGFVRGGDVIEVSVADPALGTVFYTLDQEPADRPVFRRRTDECLLCHGTREPVHVVRSVYPDGDGQPIFAAGTVRVEPSTPHARRWGGWYFTGDPAPEATLANLTFRERGSDAVPIESDGPVSERFRPERYLSPDSDLVAATVLVHQAAVHNAMTRASFDVRRALHRDAALNRELGEAADRRWPSTESVLDGAAATLADCFLGRDEAALAGPLVGSSRFAADFATAGPRDERGRSLRELDLRTRTLRHPCSYLVYSDSFTALPVELRRRFWRRVEAVLAGREPAARYTHLAATDRQAVREILLATRPAGEPVWLE